MSSKTQQLGDVQASAAIGTAAPSGDVGIELSQGWPGGARPTSYLVTAVVTGGASDLFMWGCVRHLGAGDTPADDQWGLHNNRYGTQASGKIGTALAAGTHHIVVEDVGIYTRLFFTKSANNIDIYVRPIQYSGRGN